jgi:hypothetical protein
MLKGRPLSRIIVLDGDRSEFVAWSGRQKTAQTLAMRARVVLLAAKDSAGGNCQRVAHRDNSLVHAI